MTDTMSGAESGERGGDRFRGMGVVDDDVGVTLPPMMKKPTFIVFAAIVVISVGYFVLFRPGTVYEM